MEVGYQVVDWLVIDDENRADHVAASFSQHLILVVKRIDCMKEGLSHGNETLTCCFEEIPLSRAFSVP